MSDLHQVEACARMSLMCMDDNTENRPTIQQIIRKLKEAGSGDEFDETDVNISSVAKASSSTIPKPSI